MLLARYAYLLGLAVWVGSMVALGAIAAPATFRVLQAHDPVAGRQLAGAVFGEILRGYHLLSYGLAGLMIAGLGVMAALGPRPRTFGLRVGVLAAMLAISVYSGVVLTGQIRAVQSEIGGPVGSLPEEDPRRARFGRLHGLSTMLMIVNMAGGLTLLFLEARE